MGPKYINKLIYDGYMKQYSSQELYKACLDQRMDQFPLSFEVEYSTAVMGDSKNDLQ